MDSPHTKCPSLDTILAVFWKILFGAVGNEEGSDVPSESWDGWHKVVNDLRLRNSAAIPLIRQLVAAAQACFLQACRHEQYDTAALFELAEQVGSVGNLATVAVSQQALDNLLGSTSQEEILQSTPHAYLRSLETKKRGRREQQCRISFEDEPIDQDVVLTTKKLRQSSEQADELLATFKTQDVLKEDRDIINDGKQLLPETMHWRTQAERPDTNSKGHKAIIKDSSMEGSSSDEGETSKSAELSTGFQLENGNYFLRRDDPSDWPVDNTVMIANIKRLALANRGWPEHDEQTPTARNHNAGQDGELIAEACCSPNGLHAILQEALLWGETKHPAVRPTSVQCPQAGPHMCTTPHRDLHLASTSSAAAQLESDKGIDRKADHTALRKRQQQPHPCLRIPLPQDITVTGPDANASVVPAQPSDASHPVQTKQLFAAETSQHTATQATPVLHNDSSCETGPDVAHAATTLHTLNANSSVSPSHLSTDETSQRATAAPSHSLAGKAHDLTTLSNSPLDSSRAARFLPSASSPVVRGATAVMSVQVDTTPRQRQQDPPTNAMPCQATPQPYTTRPAAFSNGTEYSLRIGAGWDAGTMTEGAAGSSREIIPPHSIAPGAAGPINGGQHSSTAQPTTSVTPGSLPDATRLDAACSLDAAVTPYFMSKIPALATIWQYFSRPGNQTASSSGRAHEIQFAALPADFRTPGPSAPGSCPAQPQDSVPIVGTSNPAGAEFAVVAEATAEDGGAHAGDVHADGLHPQMEPTESQFHMPPYSEVDHDLINVAYMKTQEDFGQCK